ncbi:MAG: ABC transporter permease [Gemmatimonadetes bacterium]|nr:ABC transporter permease [Gemmatimonadota bacterium]
MSRRLLHRRDLGTLAGLVLLSLALWAATPHFATVDNLLNVAEQSAVVGVLAVGMTFVILTGGIDLSVGSLVALCGIVAALVLRSSASVSLAVLCGVGTGVMAGALNGVLVTAGRLPPFIATLGMMSAARGVALMLADGRPISGFPDALRALASARWVGVPLPIIVLLALYGIAHLVLTRTVFGRHVYAIGGNEEAATLAGISVGRHKVVVYAMAGASAATCALLLMARLNSAQPIAGIGYELDAIAAVVIGGTSLLGGAGSVGGTLAGALIMSVLRNGLTLLGVSSYVQQVAIGVVIVAAVLVDMTLRRRAERRTA